MDIRFQVDFIYHRQQRLEEKLADIRRECPHDEYLVRDYQGWHPGCTTPRRICKACDSLIEEMPTAEELEAFAVRTTAERKEMWERQYPGSEFPESLIVKVDGSSALPFVYTTTNGGATYEIPH